MPYTEKQRKLFNAAEHDPDIAREHGMSGRTAGKLADEANELKGEGKEKKPKHAGLPPGVEVIDLSHVYAPAPRTSG